MWTEAVQLRDDYLVLHLVQLLSYFVETTCLSPSEYTPKRFTHFLPLVTQDDSKSNMQYSAIMRSIKIKFFVLTFSLLTIYLFLFYFFLEKWINRKHETAGLSSVVLKHVVVHLDLKGAPPRLSYLESLLPVFKYYGVNGLLMEYEDMFPYEGNLVNLSSRNCYDKNELKKFLNKSVLMGIEIIPLIQTFGHMEHALKLQEFKNLREVAKFPDSICPSKAGSIQLVKEMLTQVINFHTSIIPLHHFHIGCDEVYHIDKCDKCRHRNLTRIELFSKHALMVETVVHQLSPQITVLMWDDMLRGRKGMLLSNMDIANIEPVYWDYKPHLSVSHPDLLNYHRKFKDIWIASAYKGADGVTATTPDFKKRFNNHLAWLNFILDYKFGGETEVYNFKGIILTGWSRYSHMDPLCELLPASIPSLVINLILIQTLRKGVVINVAETLDSDDFFSKYIQAEFNMRFKCRNMIYVDDFDNAECSYENMEIHNELKQYNTFFRKIKDKLLSDEAILTSIDYHSQIGYINMNTAQVYLTWCKDNLKKLSNFEEKFRYLMSVYYEKDVVDEYVTSITYDVTKKVLNLLKIMKQHLKTVTWDRRPSPRNVTMILNYV
ncbi:unnamed protein product [Chrysodeixis includens]|uniref:beta-N-acetylhexosaminidase n=1 Tax=Chrysodeixis includens TaxID=689277 RepID=A0A9P0BYZ2_CHRIL|nr:unnamed protein product [Chrysodeixis includens]